MIFTARTKKALATHRRTSVYIILFFVLIFGAATYASDEEVKESGSWGFQLSRELMSPYCPGRTLADCPSSQADELRLWIYGQEQQGRTRNQVEQDLIARFGEEMLGAPRAQGFGLAAYWMPAVLFLLGGWIALRFLRHQKIKKALTLASEPAALAALDPEISRLVEEEMRE